MADQQEQPAQSCCPPNSIGPVPPPEDYVNKGKDEDVSGVRTYVVTPAQPTTRAVVVCPDVFGPDSGRTRMVCDQLSDQLQCVVAMPDYFHGHPIASESRLPMLFQAPKLVWNITKFPWRVVGQDVMDRVVPFLKATHGASCLAVVGFCFGGWAVLHACTSSEFVCGVGLHPAVSIFSIVRENLAETVKGVRVPQMMLAAGNDNADTKLNGRVHKLLEDTGLASACVFHEYKDMAHGWVNRGDLKDDAVRARVDEAIAETCAFIRKHMEAKEAQSKGDGDGDGKGKQ